VTVTNFLKNHLKKAPPFRRLIEQRNGLLAERDSLMTERESLLTARATIEAELRNAEGRLALFGEGPPFVPNGHFFSPIAPRAEIERDEAKIFAAFPDAIPGVDLNDEEQLATLAAVKEFYSDLPFGESKQEGFRYHYNNPSYCYSDGIFLNGMIRHLKPRRVIEIGSGYTSAMFLDTNERWFGNSIDLTFIEPYPDLLYSLLKEGDLERVHVHPTRLQDVDLSVFQALDPGDILFIDSTHVSRVGSDVNTLFFRVLPLLKPGVYVHFHDIFYPFEYPKVWILEGRAWNEIYLLRAFLAHNQAFRVVMFNHYLEIKHPEFFEKNMPLCLKNGGGSIWLRKE
jgi:predicted O-methyltransferase YrrM